MSLACYECRKISAFNTLILYSKTGKFSMKKTSGDYGGYYTDCASFSTFNKVKNSKFAIVEESQYSEMWSAPWIEPLGKAKFKKISAIALKNTLPKIYKALLKNES